MFKKIIVLTILLLIFPLTSALCGDHMCEKNENSENCCVDCGCSFAQTCEKNECVPAIALFSFSSEISIFLLAIIIIFAIFVIGYGIKIIRNAHNKTNIYYSKKKEDISNILTDDGIENSILDYIKKGKTIKQIKKELEKKGISSEVLDELILDVVDSLIEKAEQGLLSIKWNPQLIENVFQEVMRKYRTKPKRNKLRYHRLNLKKLIKQIPKTKTRTQEPIKHLDVLEKYIGIAIARGYSNDKISEKLVEVGWPKDKIEKLLEKVSKQYL